MNTPPTFLSTPLSPDGESLVERLTEALTLLMRHPPARRREEFAYFRRSVEMLYERRRRAVPAAMNHALDHMGRTLGVID